MTSIDEVIERSQKPGEFTERREFSVARGQAIKKLRQFALVDRYYCVLELIQSAVANGATYIDVRCDRDTLGLSYIGSSFEQTDLAQLFDFLFAAQDDVEHGPLRQLALGVNALLDFDPDKIIIETGDGTLPGTTRIIIGDDDTVQVGTPEESLDGTYLRATGLGWQRDKVKDAITERCLVAPVPILFNHDPLFGYSRQRTPDSLFGFRKTVSFDEGDLYGTIGVAKRHSGAVFRMLTHGVWIESARRTFTTRSGESLKTLGGVVTFDRLRKTADHSAIVRDGRYEEMWLRLQPYVNQLVSGEAHSSTYDVQTLGGVSLENQELLELLRNSETVVLVPPKAVNSDEYGRSARAIGESLGVPVLCVERRSLEPVQVLGGRDVDFILCGLDDEQEIEFYTQKEAGVPARPWLTSPTDLGSMSVVEVADGLRCPGREAFPPGLLAYDPSFDDASADAVRKAAWLLKAPLSVGSPQEAMESLEKWKEEVLDPLGESIRARIYTPEQRADSAREYNVEVRTAQRVVWRGNNEAIAPGQVLVVDVADLAPKQLWRLSKADGEPVAELIAEAVVRRHLSELETAADRGLEAALRADVEPGSNAAQLVLASVAQRVVKRIRPADADGRVGFSVVDQTLGVEVLDVPVLKTLSGDDVSLRGLETLMEKCHGLVYAVRVDVVPDLEGLNRDRIVVVDQILEDLLVSLVGPTAYVRIDERDVLAEYDGVVCRDVAVGLREYPDFPLPVEKADPSSWPDDRKRQCVNALVDQLIALIEAEAADGEDQELRRQAWRHLQWFAAHRDTFGFAEEAKQRVGELPLCRLTQGRTCRFRDVGRVIDRQGHVEMLDGWAVGAGELTYDEALEQRVSFDDSWPSEGPMTPDPPGAKKGSQPWPFVLRMNPFVLHLLGSAVQGAAEYHLSQREAEAVADYDVGVEAMLERVVLDDASLQGAVGLPKATVERPRVLVFDGGNKDVVLREDIGARYGVVGKVRVRPGTDKGHLDAVLAEAAEDVLSHLLIRLPEWSSCGDEASYRRALSALLEFASRRVQIIAHPDMTVEAEVDDRLARRVLNSPLLSGANGLPVSPMTVYREFERQASRALALGEELEFRSTLLSDEIDEVVASWVAEECCLTRIHRPGCYTEALDEKREVDGDDGQQGCLETTLEYWINALHPGGGEGGERFRVQVDETAFVGDWAGEFCQLVGAYGDAQGLLLRLNPEHRLSRWVMRDGAQSQRPIAWALLAAYGHINDMMVDVTGYHEMICQRRVADALEQEKLEMR